MPTHDAGGQVKGWLGAIVDIDDQKQLEERLRLVTRAVNGLVFDWNLETNEVYRSEKLFDLVGVRPEDAPASADWWRDRVHPDDMARLQPQFTELFNNTAAELYESEYRVRHTAGHWVDIWERSYLIRNEQGQIIRMVGSTVDVSDRKQAERNLTETHIQLEAALAAGAIYTWRWDLVDNVVITNRGLAHLFGIDPAAAAAGLPIEQFIAAIHQDDRPQIIAAIEQAIATREDYSKEFRVYDADGTEHWVIARGRVEYDANGRAIGFPGALTDISDRKQMEMARITAEERLRIALKNSPITVFNQDRDLRFTWVYQPALHTPNEIIGKCEQDFLLPEDAEVIAEIKQRVMETGVGDRQEVKVTKNGNEHYFDLTVEPLRDSDGNIIGITGASVDISAFKRTAVRLQENEERLRLAIEGVQMGTWDVDLITGRAVWSDQHFAMMGYEPSPTGEASEAMWVSGLHPDDREWVFQEWQQARQEHRLYRAEYRVIRADNQQVVWLAGLGSFIYNENGEAVRSMGVLYHFNMKLRQIGHRG